MWCSKSQYHGFCSVLLGMWLIGRQKVFAYDLDLESKDSVLSVSQQLTKDLVLFYNGDQLGQTPGLLPQSYYWWEGGAFMGALVDYWYYTKDTAYNDIVIRGMLHQAGDTADFMPPNQTLTEGNDDQGFWGMAVMSAAEYGFDNPPDDQPQWLALAQAVFNTQAARWDRSSCAGGLRWQIFEWNNGYDYKNSISQACFFNLAARLALYTGNISYADWATKTWDWMEEVRFIDRDFRVYDGAHVGDNCTSIVPYEFSYNVGAFLLGAAAMYEFSNVHQWAYKATWEDRVNGLLNATEDIFFYSPSQPSQTSTSSSPSAATTSTPDKVMIEIVCEPYDHCNVDQRSFKAYLARWMAATTKWCPWTLDRTRELLSNTATAAARQCTGGDNGRMCGLKWANNSDGFWDGTTGVGQQMGVLEVVLAAGLIEDADRPKTQDTGGTSPGNPAAGGGGTGNGHKHGGGPGDEDEEPSSWDQNSKEWQAWWLRTRPLTRADTAGGTLVTILLLAGLTAGAAAMIADENKSIEENWMSFKRTVLRRSGEDRGKGGGGGAAGVEASYALASSSAEDGTAPAGPATEEGRQSRVHGGGAIDEAASKRPRRGEAISHVTSGKNDKGKERQIVGVADQESAGNPSCHDGIPASDSASAVTSAATPRCNKKVSFADIPAAPAAAAVATEGRKWTKRLRLRLVTGSSTQSDSSGKKPRKGKEASHNMAFEDVEMSELGRRERGNEVKTGTSESTTDLITTNRVPKRSKRLQSKRRGQGHGETS